jgi:hypothetical protein
MGDERHHDLDLLKKSCSRGVGTQRKSIQMMGKSRKKIGFCGQRSEGLPWRNAEPSTKALRRGFAGMRGHKHHQPGP